MPYAFLNWLNPIVSITYAIFGISMARLPERERAPDE
jgi:Na+/H+ antiporter NhaC